MNSFEAHITVPREQYELAKPVAEGFGFHMSNITDDEVMGPGARAYCTKSGDDFAALSFDTNVCVNRLLRVGVAVQRKKIEAILVDRRY